MFAYTLDSLMHVKTVSITLIRQSFIFLSLFVLMLVLNKYCLRPAPGLHAVQHENAGRPRRERKVESITACDTECGGLGHNIVRC